MDFFKSLYYFLHSGCYVTVEIQGASLTFSPEFRLLQKKRHLSVKTLYFFKKVFYYSAFTRTANGKWRETYGLVNYWSE
jgi:hypothetical protein